MTFAFEQEFISKRNLISQIFYNLLDLNKKKGSLIEESLEVLRDKTLAIDADILLKKV